jgi:hypothetical protein
MKKPAGVNPRASLIAKSCRFPALPLRYLAGSREDYSRRLIKQRLLYIGSKAFRIFCEVGHLRCRHVRSGDWDFVGPDDAKAEICAAVAYLLNSAASSDHGNVVREIIEIVNEVARGLAPRHDQADSDCSRSCAAGSPPTNSIIRSRAILMSQSARALSPRQS